MQKDGQPHAEEVEEKIAGVVIDLTEEPLDMEISEEKMKEFKKHCLYCIGKDEETGDIEICPMNEENCIKLHGAEWVKDFIKQLQTLIEE